jgi:hypothetical protein
MRFIIHVELRHVDDHGDDFITFNRAMALLSFEHTIDAGTGTRYVLPQGTYFYSSQHPDTNANGVTLLVEQAVYMTQLRKDPAEQPLSAGIFVTEVRGTVTWSGLPEVQPQLAPAPITIEVQPASSSVSSV